MKTFQFTTQDDKVIAIHEFVDAIELKTNPLVENIEGIYKHGKVNSTNKTLATLFVEEELEKQFADRVFTSDPNSERDYTLNMTGIKTDDGWGFVEGGNPNFDNCLDGCRDSDDEIVPVYDNNGNAYGSLDSINNDVDEDLTIYDDNGNPYN